MDMVLRKKGDSTIEKKTSLPFTPQRGPVPTLSRDGAMFRVWEVQVPRLNIPKFWGRKHIKFKPQKQVSFQNPPKNIFIGNHQVVGKTTTPSPNGKPHLFLLIPKAVMAAQQVIPVDTSRSNEQCSASQIRINPAASPGPFNTQVTLTKQ